MNSSMIGKIEKAKRYAAEPERIRFQQFRVVLSGNHRTHDVRFDQGSWGCDCDTFAQMGYCSHTMALERVLGPMIEPIGASPSA